MSPATPSPADPHAWWCRQVVDGTADGIIVADHTGTIRVWNAGAAALLGHSAESAIGQRLDLIIPGEHQAAHWAAFEEAMVSGARRSGGPYVTFPALHRDGRTVPASASLTILRDPASGTPTGAAVIMRAVDP